MKYYFTPNFGTAQHISLSPFYLQHICTTTGLNNMSSSLDMAVNYYHSTLHVNAFSCWSQMYTNASPIHVYMLVPF